MTELSIKLKEAMADVKGINGVNEKAGRWDFLLNNRRKLGSRVIKIEEIFISLLLHDNKTVITPEFTLC